MQSSNLCDNLFMGLDSIVLLTSNAPSLHCSVAAYEWQHAYVNMLKPTANTSQKPSIIQSMLKTMLIIRAVMIAKN